MGFDGHLVLLGASDSPIILHIPHASRTIPPAVRRELLLTDDELAAELDLLTDAHTDVIAERAAESVARRPWSFVNRRSRLVVDPERFPDEREEMRAVGMGAVYTRTMDGRPLRAADAGAEERLLARWFRPYGQAMTDLVDARLAAVGRVCIIDVHSYPSIRLPYERGGDLRPPVCIGTDAAHTPDWLVDAARAAFAPHLGTAVNTPFAGCYVPLKHHRTDPRVVAVMVELRRDTYMIEPGGAPTNGLAAVIAGLAALIEHVTAHD